MWPEPIPPRHKPGGAEDDSRFREGNRHLRLTYEEEEEEEGAENDSRFREGNRHLRLTYEEEEEEEEEEVI